jgi:hypothetical protein
VRISNNQLIVSDSGNNRILIWTSFPTSNNQAANIVLGASSMTVAGTSGATANTFSGVTSLDVDSSGALYVDDAANNRVLYYASIPTANNASASAVIGQGSFTSSSSPGATAYGFNTSQYNASAVAANNRFLAVSDPANYRILVFNKPLSTGMSASLVLGKTNFSSG